MKVVLLFNKFGALSKKKNWACRYSLKWCTLHLKGYFPCSGKGIESHRAGASSHVHALQGCAQLPEVLLGRPVSQMPDLEMSSDVSEGAT